MYKYNEKFFLNLVSEGLISVSDKGIVKNLKTGNVLGSKPGMNGYHSIGWKSNKKTIHILVHRLVFLIYSKDKLNDEYPIVNHKDRNRSNNDISNLEKSNEIHNKRHAVELGSYKAANNSFSKLYSGDKGSASKLTNDQAKEIRRLNKESGLNYEELASYFGVHKTTIGRIIRNKSYKY